MANKVRFGLKNCYYSKVTLDDDNTPTYATPVKLPGAVSLSLEASSEQSTFNADDIQYYIANATNGYEGELELALIPQQFDVDCLGATVDKNGLVVERSSDNAAYFALLFEFTGDEKGIRHCIYYCKAVRGDTEAETKSDSVEVKTEKLSFTASALPGTEVVKSKTGNTTTDAVYDAWFTAVKIADFTS